MLNGGGSDLRKPWPPLREPSSGSPGLPCFPPASPRCEGLRARTALSAIAPCSRRSGVCWCHTPTEPPRPPCSNCGVIRGLVWPAVPLSVHVCVCACVYPRWGNSPVALKSRCVPDLSFDGVLVQLNRPGAELHADGGATVVVELIFGEARQEVTLPDPRLPYQNHWTQQRINVLEWIHISGETGCK